MTRTPAHLASAAAFAAALSMAATPASALDLPVIAAPAPAPMHAEVQDGDPGEANQWRRYRRDRHYRHHRRGGVDAGDVIAGVVVLGALAAIVGSSRDRDRDRERYDNRRIDSRDYDRRDYESRGIENAVDMCVEEVEYRDTRVDNVERADRSASGWTVSGTLDNGERWTCLIDNAGDVRSIDYDEGFAQTRTVSRGQQLSDAAYRNARASTRTAVDDTYTYDASPAADAPYNYDAVPEADGPRPAYPGGPLPGEEGYEEDWQAGDGDGRYSTAQTPDFSDAR
ncbi:hypothetical protein [Aurantiacibacter poecillastricola]|uniref:hypothetical protein n=1 Tax=Aurantiacibacter poecillastricola TaxID=3064385 RepID=UPI00273D17C9|nr:hypothetical protein [Aurantiacibacter sp. 219JJ12-13]MDP5261634.1 hypothetical protein [Aurantiacibacter sp. 219JJ12-13]